MKDCKGKELALGDYVAFVHGASSSPSLKTGHVTNISASGRNVLLTVNHTFTETAS